MQRNYLETAQSFFRSYETTQMQNYGVNIYLLTVLHKLKFITVPSNQLKKFINDNKKLLSTIDYRVFMNDLNSFLDNLINKMDVKKELTRGKNFTLSSQLKKIFSQLSSPESYKEYGSAYALYHDVDLLSFEEDIQQHLQDAKVSHHFDKDFKAWPINQIGSDLIYAGMGFTNEYSNQFSIGNFFHELIKATPHNPNGINHIVALGEIEKDFPGYFLTPNTYDGFANNKKIEVKVVPKKISKEEDSIDEYELYCEMTTYDNNNKADQKQTRDITLTHISLSDGTAIKFSDDAELEKFHDSFLQKFANNKAVLIHCKQSLDLTGQLVAQYFAIKHQLFQEIFSQNEPKSVLKNLNGFINDKLRAYRAGLIISPLQLHQALLNVNVYLQLKYKQEMKEENLQKLQDAFVSFEVSEEKVTSFDMSEYTTVSSATDDMNLVQEVKDDEIDDFQIVEKKEKDDQQPKSEDSLTASVSKFLYSFWSSSTQKENVAEPENVIKPQQRS